MPYSGPMSLLTVIESPIFTRYWPDYWSAEQHGEFVAYIAGNPEAGDVIRDTAENIPAHVLRQLAEELGHAPE